MLNGTEGATRAGGDEETSGLGNGKVALTVGGTTNDGWKATLDAMEGVPPGVDEDWLRAALVMVEAKKRDELCCGL